MLKDAVLRVLQAADHRAVRGILVNANDARAKVFYERFGFRHTPALPMKLMITIEEAERAMRDGGQFWRHVHLTRRLG